MVALATLAALPLFLFENPDSTGALTGVAGADTRAIFAAELEDVIELPQIDLTISENTAFLVKRAAEWHNARAALDINRRLKLASLEYEAEALTLGRSIANSEFEKEELRTALFLEEEQRTKLFAEEDARRERALNTPGPTTTIVATEPDPNGASDVQWDALRYCESTGNYGAVSPTGNYRGAYQFSIQTWDWIADLYHNELVGIDPSLAKSEDQDRMARSLYALRGRGQWPVCGRYLP